MRRLLRAVNRMRLAWNSQAAETQLLLFGERLVNTTKARGSLRSLHEAEFRVFSQFGDDGIIQWLVGNLDIWLPDVRRIRRGRLPRVEHAISDDERQLVGHGDGRLSIERRPHHRFRVLLALRSIG